jgi:hypothetical protein
MRVLDSHQRSRSRSHGRGRGSATLVILAFCSKQIAMNGSARF